MSSHAGSIFPCPPFAPSLAAAAEAATTVSVELVVELLLIAAAVVLVTKRFRIPYTVALTVVGIGVGFTHFLHPVLLSKEIVLLVFLPPLLFEATLAMDLATLRSKWLEVLVLALPVTFLSVAAIALPVHWIFKLDLVYCLLLGSILAPTDPVSVIALFKEAGVSKKLAHIVEGESCFNDGAGVVLYLIFLGALVTGGDVKLAAGARLFGVEVLGGLGVGIVAGYLVYRILSRIDDHLLEVTVSIVLAFGVYVLSDRLHVSGVVAVVAAGLIMGNYGKAFAMSPTTRLALSNFWEVMAFIVNSLVFLLMGIAIESVNLLGAAGRIVTIYLLVTASRFVLVHVAGAFLSLLGRTMPMSWRHLTAWSGLRGSVSVALAIGIPSVFAAAGGDRAIPTREETLTVVSGVVLLSMLVQGLTMRGLIQRLGLAQRDAVEEKFDVELAREVALGGASRELDALASTGRVPAPVLAELRATLEKRRERLGARITDLLERHAEIAEARRGTVARALLVSGRAAVEEAFRRGEISEHAEDLVTRELDAWLQAGDGPMIPPPDETAEGDAGTTLPGASGTPEKTNLTEKSSFA